MAESSASFRWRLHSDAAAMRLSAVLSAMHTNSCYKLRSKHAENVVLKHKHSAWMLAGIVMQTIQLVIKCYLNRD